MIRINWTNRGTDISAGEQHISRLDYEEVRPLPAPPEDSL